MVVPSPVSGVRLVFKDRTCGTERTTNLCVGSSKPSTFSRIPPALRSLLCSRSAKAASCSDTKSGSFGFVLRSAATKVGSIVVLLATGWQVPHVRPFPLKVSRKKMSAPAHTWAETSPAITRGSLAQALSRSCAVSSADAAPSGSGSSSAAGLEHETTDAAAMAAPTMETR
jgi:hypothetical protein